MYYIKNTCIILRIYVLYKEYMYYIKNICICKQICEIQTFKQSQTPQHSSILRKSS